MYLIFIFYLILYIHLLMINKQVGQQYQLGKKLVNQIIGQDAFQLKYKNIASKYPYKLQVHIQRGNQMMSIEQINKKIQLLKEKTEHYCRFLIHQALQVPQIRQNSFGIIYRNLDNSLTFKEAFDYYRPQKILLWFLQLLNITASMHDNSIFHDDYLTLDNIYISLDNEMLYLKGFNCNKETASIQQDKFKIKYLLEAINDYFTKLGWQKQGILWQQQNKNVNLQFCLENKFVINAQLNIHQKFLKIIIYDDNQSQNNSSRFLQFIFEDAQFQKKEYTFGIKNLYCRLLKGKKTQISIVNKTIKILIKYRHRNFIITKESNEKQLQIKQHSSVYKIGQQINVVQKNQKQLSFPFNQIGCLAVRMRNIDDSSQQSFFGTGLYLGHRLVLTCAHNFYKVQKDKDGKKRVYSNRVGKKKMPCKFILQDFQYRQINNQKTSQQIKQTISKTDRNKNASNRKSQNESQKVKVQYEENHKNRNLQQQKKDKMQMQLCTSELQFKIIDYKFLNKYKTDAMKHSQDRFKYDFALVLLEDHENLQLIGINDEYINLMREFDAPQELQGGGYHISGKNNQGKIDFKHADKNSFGKGDRKVGIMKYKGVGKQGMSGGPILIKYSNFAWGVIGIHVAGRGDDLIGVYFNKQNLNILKHFQKQLTNREANTVNQPLIYQNIKTNQNIFLYNMEVYIQKAENSIYSIDKLNKYCEAYKYWNYSNKKDALISLKLEVNHKNLNMLAFFKIIQKSYDYYSNDLLGNTNGRGFFIFYLYGSMMIFRVLQKQFQFPQEHLQKVQRFIQKWNYNFKSLDKELQVQVVKEKWLPFHDELCQMVKICEWDPITQILMRGLLQLLKQTRSKFQIYGFFFDYPNVFELVLKYLRLLDYIQLIDRQYYNITRGAIKSIPSLFNLLRKFGQKWFMDISFKAIKYLDNFKPKAQKVKQLVFVFKNLYNYDFSSPIPIQQIMLNSNTDAMNFINFMLNQHLPENEGNIFLTFQESIMNYFRSH